MRNRTFPRMSSGPKTAMRLFRIARGLTQAQLAESLGVRQSLISEIEISRSCLDPTLAVRIADALGVDIFEIFPPEDHRGRE